MSPLHMLELQPDLSALLRFLHSQGLETKDGDEDLGYGVHAWLTAAFGELAPKPWRLLRDRRRPPRVLGYSHYSAEELRQQMHEFATPAAFSVCPPDAIAGRAMPAWRPGRRLAFEVQCCPVGRKAGTGIEKDLFLIHADTEPETELRREAVYCDWASEQLQRNGAATISAIRLAGFRLIRQTRQTQSSTGARRRSHPVRPQALLRGELTVTDPDAFSALLARGVGRHRAFGYGMLLLKPPS